ncbi:MAG: TRAP transporter large permease subunit [Desulforhopalus sp.]|jgi:TRAP-type mannitol/chloroaromatic compound transport system permease large subunit|nr:TRAP transporter large permease subunit [Desulforhopalus sp.]
MNLPLDLLLVVALISGILIGYPVSFTLAGVATIFAFLGWLTGNFDLSLLGALAQRVFGLLTNDVLIAIPLFVLMGVVLEKSRIAEDLLETMGRLFGRMRGGLGISVVVVGALLAASTGIVGATVVAMGLIALPTMLRNHYQPALACGIVCTSGTLGQIIPPSTLLIILADVMSNAYQQAQFARGQFTIDTISVGQMFAAALLPGLMLVSVYIIYLLIRAWWSPHLAPAMSGEDFLPVTLAEVAGAVFPPILLIVAVLGSILGGIATPSEAAAVGAVGAILLAGARLGKAAPLMLAGTAAFVSLAVLAGLAPIRLQRIDAGAGDWAIGGLCLLLILLGFTALFKALQLTSAKKLLTPILSSTMVVTAMIFATILTASIFSLVFIGLGGEERIEWIITTMPGGAQGALIFCMALIFLLGFFLDFVEISVILLPLIAPTLILMGHDPIWLSVLIAINLQTSFLTPPFGFSLFYLRGAAPPEVSTGQIYRGVVPFIALQAVGAAIIWYFPKIATFLPKLMF